MSAISSERQALEHALERDARELRDALAELREAVRRDLDPRAHIARHPYAWLIGSFVLGMWLGHPR
jgi:hypothetical protein